MKAKARPCPSKPDPLAALNTFKTGLRFDGCVVEDGMLVADFFKRFLRVRRTMRVQAYEDILRKDKRLKPIHPVGHAYRR